MSGRVLGQQTQPQGPDQPRQQLRGDGPRGQGRGEGRLPPLHPGRVPGQEDQRPDWHQHRDTDLQPGHTHHHPHKTGKGTVQCININDG